MPYSDFSLSDIKERFGISIEQIESLFPDLQEMEASTLLTEVLRENIPLALAIHTEKARSELIIVPILVELRKTLGHKISLFSGIDFTVDREKGLTGVCDYIISLSKDQLLLSSPIISIVEAKNDNLKAGLAQCAAEMIAARIFNENRGNKIKEIYGVVTTGSLWKFMKLKASLYVDEKEYYLENLGKILGILNKIVTDGLRGIGEM